MRICDLKNKEVINVCDCKSLGCVVDIDFDECSGCITALICGIFGRDLEYIIPFKCVRGIGPDAILVDVCVEKVTHKCL